MKICVMDPRGDENTYEDIDDWEVDENGFLSMMKKVEVTEEQKDAIRIARRGTPDSVKPLPTIVMQPMVVFAPGAWISVHVDEFIISPDE